MPRVRPQLWTDLRRPGPRRHTDGRIRVPGEQSGRTVPVRRAVGPGTADAGCRGRLPGARGGGMKLRAAIKAIEARRNSRVLVLAASHLRLDLLPTLYDALCALGPSPRLDVVFQSPGGHVTAARRIGLLLDEFTDHLAFI